MSTTARNNEKSPCNQGFNVAPYKGKGHIRKGKTAKDKANGHIPHQKNRRIWDEKEHVWHKA